METLKKLILGGDNKMSTSICPICKGAASTDGQLVNRLADGAILCEKCAAKTRFLYPVGKDSVKKRSRGAFVNGDYDVESYTTYESKKLINPLEKMTFEEIKQVLEETDRVRAKVKEKYKEYKCALMVDDCERIISTGQGKLSLDEKYIENMYYSLRGRVIYGELHKGDTLVVKRREREESVTVDSLNNLLTGSDLAGSTGVVYEGNYANMSLGRDLSFIYPGDVLTVR